MNLRFAREDMQLTQKQLGELAGLDESTIWRMENKQHVSMKTRRAVARAIIAKGTINPKTVEELKLLYKEDHEDTEHGV